MAKKSTTKKSTTIAAPVAVSEVSIPTIVESHKDPAQRTHLWERPARVDEQPTQAPVHADYAHALPRWVHQGANQLYVTTPDACEAALANGYVIDPNEAA